MPTRRRPDPSEIQVDRLFLESFANEASAFYRESSEGEMLEPSAQFKSRLVWHINHSLSPRQKAVLKAYLSGQTERQIAQLLGIKQQVVNIYKHRAIKRLRDLVGP